MKQNLGDLHVGSIDYNDYISPWTDHGEEFLYGLTPKQLRTLLVEMTQSEYHCRFILPTKVGLLQ